MGKKGIIMPLEKMSKSRGNVVTPEEVVYGVRELKEGYEFRSTTGELVDYEEINIYQNPEDHYFYTTTRFGKQPVFLCEKDNSVPAIILWNGMELLQHFNLVDYWENKLKEQKWNS
jgi:hypothetical protein